jgi:tetratricopeptide (TPR) repeat protein
LDPTFPNNHYDIMNVLIHMGRLEGAAGACRAALELLPLGAQLYIGMGIINEWLGCSAEVMQAYTRVIEIEPNNLEGYAGVCQVCVDGKSPEEGEAIASEITRHTGRPIELLKGMAFALKTYGRCPEARSYWKRVLELVPDDIVALIEAARLELGIRNVEAASSLYDRAWALDPTNPTLIWHRVFFYIRIGQLDRALELKRADLDSLRQPAIPPKSVLESPQVWRQSGTGRRI